MTLQRWTPQFMYILHNFLNKLHNSHFRFGMSERAADIPNPTSNGVGTKKMVATFSRQLPLNKYIGHNI
jgi:hypothetical protein